MYLANEAIITLDLGKLNILQLGTKDYLRDELGKEIIFYFKKEVEKNNINLIDLTPYNEVFYFRGEGLKKIKDEAKKLNSSLHINLNLNFSNNNEVTSFVKEGDGRGLKFAENIGYFFEKIDYKNKGVKKGEVYNLIYFENTSILINLNIKRDLEISSVAKDIGSSLAKGVLNLGTK